MTKDKISIKFLIHLVGERPALWDKTSESYKDRLLKETSWREICTFVNENYEHMQPPEKREYTKMVAKKWTHIRDAWIKSLKYGYDEKTKLPAKPYVYHDELKFLQKILKYRRRRYDLSVSSFERYYESKIDATKEERFDDPGDGGHDHVAEHTIDSDSSSVTATQEQEDYGDWQVEDNQTPRMEIIQELSPEVERDKQQRKLRQKRPSFNTAQKCHSLRSTSCDNNQSLIENRHWNFFKGIFPSVNSLVEDHTLQFQAGIISLLQKLKASQKQAQKTTKGRKTRIGDEWPMDNVVLSQRYSTRSAKHAADPIGGEQQESGDETESEHFSEDS